jgi:lysophospholipase L1-like esterase
VTDLDWLVRFQRPRAMLELHDLSPTTDLADARAFGIPATTLRRLCARHRAIARKQAAGLIRRDARVPFARGDLVVGLGDSITSDALSWFELLAAALRGSGARFVNVGISGDTTADLRKRAFRIAALRPRWLLVLIGTNDCQRHEPRGDLLVSPGETLRNLLALDAALRRPGTTVVWIAPSPVDEDGLSDVLLERGLRFRNADLRAVARSLHEVCDGFVDVQDAFVAPGLWEDGLHPSLAGQRLIAGHVLDALA